ncbi:MAG TPA: DUF559 domain-containing protein [Fimbriimonas sp.]|nr:DUF559 domain-containing protein [Fimbriimonas sp.]
MGDENSKTGLAQSLRARMTPAERKLWYYLRAERFHGLSWRRQQPIGQFIADFYCSTARVVVELDGQSHGFSLKEDKERDDWLAEQGIQVLRFDNHVALWKTSLVLDSIYLACLGCLEEGD